MARKSRRSNIQQTQISPVRTKVGIYTRISVEDKGLDTSIQNQEILCLEYINRNEDLEYVKTYSDNGISSFAKERKAFSCMLEDVKQGVINCIIVKDISRFNRDYLVTMQYIETVFLMEHVRMISVLEGYDSQKEGYNNWWLSLISIRNKLYSKDVSRKVKSAICQKQQSGTYTLPKVPYGYKKIKEEVVIEDDEGKIVRTIFQKALSGESIYRITRYLNTCYPDVLWTQKKVGGILKNDFYTGICRFGKSKKILELNKLEKVPIEEQIIVENHHEALVNKQDFEQVNGVKYIPAKASTNQNKQDVFHDILYCDDCKRKMRRVKRKVKNSTEQKYSYVCATYIESDGTKCSRNTVTDDGIIAMIETETAERVRKAKVLQKKQLTYEQSKLFQIWQKGLEGTVQELKHEQEKYSLNRLHTKYEDFVEKSLMCRNDYIVISAVYRERYLEIEKQIMEIEKELSRYWEEESSQNRKLCKELQYETLSVGEMIVMIKKIYVKNRTITHCCLN